MKHSQLLTRTCLLALAIALPLQVQTRPGDERTSGTLPPFQAEPAPVAVAPNLAVIRLIRFSGTARGAEGQGLAGTVGITFALYREQEGGAPLWLETQNVALDQRGHYTALLGATSNDGLPLEVFTSGEARWLGIQVHGQAEQRVLLVSVPYALKAAEAETLSGRKASDFILSEQLSTRVEEAINTQIEEQGLVTTEEAGNLAQVTGSGSVGQIAKFVTSTEVGDSVITESNGRIGIGFATPVQKLVIGAAGGRMLNVSNLANQDLEIRVSTRFAADKFALIAPTTPTNLALGVGGAEKMRITNAGDVGIGTSTPFAKFEVLDTANNVGVKGVAGTSASGLASVRPIGIWGDSTGAGPGVLATNNDAQPALEVQNHTTGTGFLIVALDENDTPRFTVDMDGNMDVSGDMTVTGTKSAAVQLASGQRVAMFALESPENWFEDFGSGQLIMGEAAIVIDPGFAQTVNTSVGYHVFLTPNGDCKGLYVAQKTPGAFTVRELGNGRSSVSFDYRIVARRKGYETLRLPELTPGLPIPTPSSRRKLGSR